ncbi:hypothetical protein, partial [Uruburuella suis]|uniref:hypothetical protein n=1 Tax=Uruburuella suis TaxID=252130 RepID=UPI0024920DFE
GGALDADRNQCGAALGLSDGLRLKMQHLHRIASGKPKCRKHMPFANAIQAFEYPAYLSLLFPCERYVCINANHLFSDGLSSFLT